MDLVIDRLSLAEGYLYVLVACLLKGALLLVGAGLMYRGLRRRSAATRHYVWVLVLSMLVLLPALTFLAPSWSLPMLPPRYIEAEGARQGIIQSDLSAPGVAVVSSESVANEASVWLEGYALLLWGTVGFVFLIRLLVDIAGMRAMTRRARLVGEPEWHRSCQRMARTLGLKRPVTLLQTDEIDIPITWGVRRAVILLPDSAKTWTPERQEAVLLHELAHVKRHDFLTNLIAQLACAVHWLNPLVWVASRRFLVERERACDDCVLAANIRATAYAHHLVEVARQVVTQRTIRRSAVAMARVSELEERVCAILNRHAPRSAMSLASKIGMAVFCFGVVLPLAAFRPGVSARTIAENEWGAEERTAARASAYERAESASLPDEPAASITGNDERARPTPPSENAQEVREVDLRHHIANVLSDGDPFSVWLPRSGLLTITMYNLPGREVAVLVDSVLRRGTHSFPFDKGTLENGTYILVLRFGDYKGVKRIRVNSRDRPG